MMPLFEFIGDNVIYLLSLWADPAVEAVIGANFLYIMISLWLVWIMVNIFVIRPLPIGLFRIRAKDRETSSDSRNYTYSSGGVKINPDTGEKIE